MQKSMVSLKKFIKDDELKQKENELEKTLKIEQL